MKAFTFNLILLAAVSVLMFTKAHADDRKTDGEILGLLMAADKSEIDAAHQAEGKNISSEVMDFAKMLDKEHSDDLAKLQDLQKKTGITPPGTAGAMIMAKGTKGLAMRAVLNNRDYEKAYINDMVNDHLDDIHLIDNDLMKDVQNPDLKAQMADTRNHVDKHLKKAQELQSKIV